MASQDTSTSLPKATGEKTLAYVFLYNFGSVCSKGGGKRRDLFIFQPQRSFHHNSGRTKGCQIGVGDLCPLNGKFFPSKKPKSVCFY